MIPSYLWGYPNKGQTLMLKRHLATLQPSKRFSTPVICILPDRTLSETIKVIQIKILKSNGQPNIQVIFLHPHLRTLDINTVYDNLAKIVRTAAFFTKTYIIFCDATGCHSNHPTFLISDVQINQELRRLTAQYPLNSLYVDLHQVITTKDWTSRFNLRVPGQIKLGQAVTRAISGTPNEIFQYG